MGMERPTQTQEVVLPWGEGELKVRVPSGWNMVYPERGHVLASDARSELAIVTSAVENPVGLDPISRMNLVGKNVVIIVDDNTRPTPVFKYFSMVLDKLEAACGDLSRVLLIPALGIHTPMTKEEMAAKVGGQNLSRLRWENHDAFDAGKNCAFGTTTRGTPVALNSHLEDAELIVLMGLIEPHLMAGFGGGMKNILPGVAAADTIGVHHQLLTDPPETFNRVGMEPRQNNFRLDFEEVAGMISADIFCINVVIDHGGQVMAAFAGDPIEAHRQGVDYTRKAQGRHLPEQVDGIIVNSYPMDINFKQSMKCVGNALPALKPGGAVMGFLKADRGMDDLPLPDKMRLPLFFIKGLLRIIGPKHVFALLKVIKKGLNAEETFLYYYILQLIRAHDLFLYVPSLTVEETERLFYFDHCAETGEVIRKGVKKIGHKATIAVFPEGGATYPIVFGG